ncbi:metallopeptidase family protein [Microbacterium sp. gxy059]|uniref:metallopeptidase family protein n=1 Tax=Microbacterium sp. gxy059 TaxID=2957199 RepID=UPI003D962F2C
MKWWDRARRERVDQPLPSPARHGRHGRAGGGSLTRPPFPAVGSRFDRFDMTLASSADFLRSTWPELRDVRFDIERMPQTDASDDVPRWAIDRERKRIVVFRVPVERLERAHGQPMHQTDEFHRRLLIESVVFRAAAEYLGRDPWDLGLDHPHD